MKVVPLIHSLPEEGLPLTDAKQIALKAAGALSDVKGKEILILDFLGKSSFTDFFVMATGDSQTHMQALANRVREAMAKEGARIDHSEGRTSPHWILLDYQSVIVHIFSKKARDYYALDHLWGDVKVIPWSDEDPSRTSSVHEENGTWD